MNEQTYSYDLTERGDHILVKRSETKYACVSYENGQVKNGGYFSGGKSDQAIDYVVQRWVSRATAVRQFNSLTGRKGQRL